MYEDMRPAAFPVGELTGRGFEEAFFSAGVRFEFKFRHEKKLISLRSR